MKLIATVLALTFALLLTGCVNRDRQNDTVGNNAPNDTVITDGTGPNDHTEEVPDPATDAAYDADGSGRVEPEIGMTDHDRVANGRTEGDTVMDNVTDAADDAADTVGDVARRVVDGAEDVADDMIDGVDRAADNMTGKTNRKG